jgi:sugar lactone lactonase YvrE
VLGDDEVRVFESDGRFVRGWSVPPGAAAVATDPAGRVYVGAAGRVEFFDADGRHTGGFAVSRAGQPAAITALKVHGDEVLVGDAAARCIRRFDRSGQGRGEIGNQDRTRGFMLPNRAVDFDVDDRGVVYATDTGRHRVAAWSLAGVPLATFGRFGHANPEDFVGCCNPVNLALAPGGRIVTGEKMIARVKMYTRDGRLVAAIAPAHFDQAATHLHLAVTGTGRILVGDPARREVKAFVPAPAVPGGEGGREGSHLAF